MGREGSMRPGSWSVREWRRGSGLLDFHAGSSSYSELESMAGSSVPWFILDSCI